MHVNTRKKGGEEKKKVRIRERERETFFLATSLGPRREVEEWKALINPVPRLESRPQHTGVSIAGLTTYLFREFFKGRSVFCRGTAYVPHEAYYR